MSINLYFKNSVRELSSFKSERYPDNSGDKITLNGSNLHGDKGRLYAMWNEGSPIPDDLKDHVEEVTFQEFVPRMAAREYGIYRHLTAECDLMPAEQGNAKRERPMFWFRMTAKNLEDIQELKYKIMTGTIRPEESYEGPQGGKSRRQLECELQQTQQQLGEALEESRLLRTELDSRVSQWRLLYAGKGDLQRRFDLIRESLTNRDESDREMLEKIEALRKYAHNLDCDVYPFFHNPWVAKKTVSIKLWGILNPSIE